MGLDVKAGGHVLFYSTFLGFS